MSDATNPSVRFLSGRHDRDAVVRVWAGICRRDRERYGDDPYRRGPGAKHALGVIFAPGVFSSDEEAQAHGRECADAWGPSVAMRVERRSLAPVWVLVTRYPEE